MIGREVAGKTFLKKSFPRAPFKRLWNKGYTNGILSLYCHFIKQNMRRCIAQCRSMLKDN